MSWLIPILGAVAAAVTLFLSKPERRRWALVTVGLLLVPAIWQAVNSYQDHETTAALRRRAYDELIATTNDVLNVLGQLEAASSNGWVPKNEADFFSQRAMENICDHLDINAPALVFPSEPLWRWAGAQMRRDRNSYKKVLSESGPYLGAKLIEAVRAAESRSVLFGVFINRTDAANRYLPPSFCGGIATDVAKSMPALKELVDLLRSRESPDGQRISDEWKLVGQRNISGKLGRARIDHAQR